jgi:hypothetical protein
MATSLTRYFHAFPIPSRQVHFHCILRYVITASFHGFLVLSLIIILPSTINSPNLCSWESIMKQTKDKLSIQISFKYMHWNWLEWSKMRQWIWMTNGKNYRRNARSRGLHFITSPPPPTQNISAAHPEGNLNSSLMMASNHAWIRTEYVPYKSAGLIL